MKIIKLSIINLLFISTILSAQPIANQLGDVIPATPNAAALTKYSDIPVSYFTGTPNISIPFYTCQNGPLSIPISIQYHASGVRVSETASWVGMGWSLNAGGVINRTVQNAPDERGIFGYLKDGFNRNYPCYSDTPATPSELSDAATGGIDSEPDIFSFNFAGYSGKFIFDETGKAVIMPKMDLKVLDPDIGGIPNQNIVSGDIIRRFTIVTPDGNLYHFGGVPETINDNVANENLAIDIVDANNGQIASVNTWYLVKIESPNKKMSINLDYVEERYSYKMPAHNSRYSNLCNEGTFSTDNIKPGTREFDEVYFHKFDVRGKRLHKITTPTSTITFDPDNPREDLDTHPSPGQADQARALKAIRINSGTDSASFCKRFGFKYSYFEDPSGTESYYKRLQLVTIKEESCSGTPIVSIPPHVFSYYDNDSNSGNADFLPFRLTKAVDHWGYYNGEDGNDTITVNTPPTTLTFSDGGTISFGIARREPHVTKMKYGILEKITYPTGGSTSFTYEPHAYATYNYEDAMDMPVIDIANCDGTDSQQCCAITGNVDTYTFTSTEQINSARFNLKMTPLNGPSNCDVTKLIRAEIFDGLEQKGVLEFNPSSNTAPEEITANLLDLSTALELDVEYQFSIYVQGGQGEFKLWIDTPVLEDPEEFASGVRIQQILTHDGLDSSNDIIKTFQYTETSTSTTSSGILFKQPKYGFLFNASYLGSPEFIDPDAESGTRYFAMFQGQSIFPLSNFEGYTVGYKRVEELWNNNGKKVLTYHLDAYEEYDGIFPYPPDPMKVLNGNLRKESNFKQEGSNFAEIASTETIPYSDYYTPLSAPMYKVTTLPNWCGGNVIAFNCYEMRTGIYRPGEIIEIMDGIEKRTTFEYQANDENLAPSVKTIQNNDGKKYEERYFYAFDLNSEPTNAMSSRNMIHAPIQIDQWVEVNGVSVQMDGSETTYALFDDDGDLCPNCQEADDLYPYPNFYSRYEQRVDEDGLLGDQTQAYTIKALVSDYTSEGFPKGYLAAGWAPEYYEWDNDLLIKRTFLDFEWTYDYYDDTRMVKSTTDPDDQTINYQYDGLMRLEEITGRNGQQKTEFDYDYHDVSEPENSVTTTVTYQGILPMETVQYLDGLGRPTRKVEKNYSSSGEDVTTEEIRYDNQGRIEQRTELPGEFITFNYEASPLNRPFQQIHPDNSTITTNFVGAFLDGNFYNGTIINDENEHQTINYTDNLGRQVAVKNAKGDFTQYTYDLKSNLINVTTPAGKNYLYEYDKEDNMTSKFIPGGGVTQYEYETFRDLLTKTTDANGNVINTVYDGYGRVEKTKLGSEDITENIYVTGKTWLQSTKAKVLEPGGMLGDWLTTTFDYDDFGRVTVTRADNLFFDGSDVTATSYNAADWTTNSVRYHANGTGESHVIFYEYDYDDRGRLISTYHKVDNTPLYMLSHNRYNEIDQLIEKNIFPGSGNDFLQSVDYIYNNRGWLTHINDINQDINDDPDLAIPPSFTTEDVYLPCPQCPDSPCDPWDDLCRDPIRIRMLDPATIGISPNSLEYNVDLFNLQLEYDNPSYDTATAQYNGNISTATWRSGIGSTFVYTYEYDELNRLTGVNFFPVVNGITVDAAAFVPALDPLVQPTTYSMPAGAYSLPQVTYDEDGDIQTLFRKGLLVPDAGDPEPLDLDILDYSYNDDHHLGAIIEGGDETAGATSSSYTYDDNGNLISDTGKGITNISYNHLNLPAIISFSGGKSIKFWYDANGKKLKKQVFSFSLSERYYQHYTDGIEYRQNGTGLPVLEAIYHDEGRVIPSETHPTGWQYEFTLRDHLGNSRVMFSDINSDGILTQNEILQEQHYYPFGSSIDGPWEVTNPDNPNKYQYNGKEANRDFGLNWYDYGARWYMPEIGRWNAVDQLAEDPMQIDKSPYAYTWNNPVNLTDPDGNCPNCVTAAIGFGVGAVVGAGFSIINQIQSGEGVSLEQTLIDGAAGAVSGGVIGSGAGLIAGVGGIASTGGLLVAGGTGFGASVAGDLTKQGLEVATGNREGLDIPEMAENAAVAIPLNMVGGLGGSTVSKPLVEGAKKHIFTGPSKESLRTAQKNISKTLKNQGASKNQIKEGRKGVKADFRKEVVSSERKAEVGAQVTITVGVQSSKKIINNVIDERN